MIELPLLNELILTRPLNQKSVIFVIIGKFQVKGLDFNLMPTMGVMMSLNRDHIAILNIHGVDYCCIISRISKNEAKYLTQNIDLTEKRETL